MTPTTGENARHLAAIALSVDAGFRFLHLPDAHGVVAIHAERRRYGAVDTFTFRAADEAVAARFRDDDYAAARSQPLWQRSGSVAEVVTELLALPPHGTSGSPALARRAASSLWLPGTASCW
jgi:catechol 2,3-dioxygenase-like lactoylglutathione lyase family enzyme